MECALTFDNREECLQKCSVLVVRKGIIIINAMDQGGRSTKISLEKVISHSIFPFKISQSTKSLQKISYTMLNFLDGDKEAVF